MGYRGDDLDLRTPQTRGAGGGAGGAPDAGWSGAEAGRGRGYAGRGPIWVDDTLLACANHAFDVALAHRAGEVRIEHLLYALTRIDAAAETLEKRGVRVAGLRRESATVIASDIPVGLPATGGAVPRRSEGLEEALRLAAAEAGHRNAPATPDDLLTVLLDIRPDLPGLGLLARHTVRDPLREPPRERVRMPAGSYYVQEPPRGARPDIGRPEMGRSELAATPADTIQNSRIEALEQMVRALSHDLAGERKSFQALLQDMQRDFMATRDDQSRLGGGLYDRLQSLEHLVAQGRGGDGAPQVYERLQGLEIGLDKRLAELSRTWSGLSDRLHAVEQALSSGASEQGRHWAAATDRLKSLEQAVGARGAGAVDLTPISDRLDVIEEALLSPDAATTREVSERLASIERLVQSQRAEIIAETEVLKADVAALAQQVARQAGHGDLIQQLAALLDQERGSMVAAVTGPLLQRVNALGAVAETRHGEQTASMGQLAERLAAAERALTLAVQRSEESHKAYAQELSELHDALMKLNTNQHTLAGSIDQWRTHGAGELTTVSKRLEALEREAGRPIAMLEQMSGSLEAMHRLTVSRHHRRNRFWYWLLGTDDWVAASWPSQLSKLEAERTLVKPAVRR